MNEAEKTVADEERKRKKKAYMDAYYSANREKLREKSQAYRLAWPEKWKATKERSKSKNPETLIKWSVSYYIKNQEKIQARLKAFRSQYPEKVRHASNLRRARKRNGGTLNDPVIQVWDKAWREKNRVRCYWCNGLFGPSRCHADHIVALSKGGTHRIDNLCISCAPCNSRKHNKDVSLWNKQLISPVLF
jgi:5-methylcytosine-specific restriction endonuclease McrA